MQFSANDVGTLAFKFYLEMYKGLKLSDFFSFLKPLYISE